MEKEIFMFWWDYYLRGLFTISERESFCNILENYDVDICINILAYSYLYADSSPRIILEAIRDNKEKEFVKIVCDSISKLEELTKYTFDLYKLEVMAEIKRRYDKCIRNKA